MLVGGSRWDAERLRGAAAIRRGERACPSRAPFAARTCSTTVIRNYAGDVGIGVNPQLAARVREADVLLVIGERLGEITTSRLHAASTCRNRGSACVHVHPDSGRAGHASTSRRSPIAATPGAFLAAMNRETPLRADARYGANAALALPAEWVAWRAPRPVAGSLDMWQVVTWLDGAAARRCDSHQRRRQLHGVAAPPVPLSRLSHAARAVFRRDGLRRARGRRGQGRSSGTHGRLVERRRLLPDERPGARHRRCSTASR